MTGNANLYAVLEDRFKQAGGRTAFRSPDGARLSYDALTEAVGRFGNALKSFGVKPGDRVTAQVEKSLDTVALYLAVLKTGAVYQPLNTAYMAAEIDYFVSDAEPTVMVTTTERRTAMEEIAARRGVAAVVTLDGAGAGTLAEEAARSSPDCATEMRQGDDLAGLLYTSGTTGRSKGAMLTHENLASNALTLHDLWGFVPGDVLLHTLPIFHVHGLYVALNTAFLNGSEIIWLDRFDADTVIDLLPQASVMMGVPTFYTRLLAHDGFTRDTCRSMRLFISGSAPLLAETHEAFTARTGHRILERYGMTECGMITSNPYDGARVAGTVGYALPGVSVRIADDEGRELPRGEVGIIECKGPNVFKGYWRMPEKTAEEFRADGWFISGDLAVMAEDGRITIVGRAKDLIISGGFNVYPKEVEVELDQLAGIGESAVIGVSHPDFGEGVIAVVTPGNGAATPEEAEVIAALSQRLARFKVPKRVFYVDELPRNTMGKVQKAALKTRYGDTFS